MAMTDASVDPQILRDIPIFQSLSEVELLRVLQAPENGIEEFEAKKNIIKDGYIIPKISIF